jgi:hypothetical protein
MSTNLHKVQPIVADKNDDGREHGGTMSSIINDDDVDNDDVILSMDATGQNEARHLWLVLESTNDSHGNGNISVTYPQRNGALLSSVHARDKYIQRLAAAADKKRHQLGYSVHKISSLQDLQGYLQNDAATLPGNPSVGFTLRSTAAAEAYASSTRTFTPPSLDEVKRFELFRAVIDHEDDLLNQRVSWIILAQSFLMAAFISAASNVENRTFLYITAAVGLATVMVTMPALVAAGQNIEVQQRVYFLGLESDEQCRRLHGHERDVVFQSPNEMMERNTKGHVFPNTAYRGRFGIPILKTVMGLAIVQVAGWCGLLISLVVDW